VIKSMSRYEKILLACVCVLCIGVLVNMPHKERISNLPLENVVQIKVISTEIDWYTGEFVEWRGSGVFIRDNLILTAGHIVDSISDANIFTIDGKEYKAKSWYLETEIDIGFIEVGTNDIESTLSFDDAKLGEEVWAFGNPFGEGLFLTKGIVSAISVPDIFMGTKNMVVTDAAINPGNSGCALFNKQGKIVGICSWIHNHAQGMSHFVKANIIELSLKKYFAIKALENAK